MAIKIIRHETAGNVMSVYEERRGAYSLNLGLIFSPLFAGGHADYIATPTDGLSFDTEEAAIDYLVGEGRAMAHRPDIERVAHEARIAALLDAAGHVDAATFVRGLAAGRE